MNDTPPSHVEKIASFQVEILRGHDCYQFNLVKDGRHRHLQSESFDMADKQERRRQISMLLDSIAMVIRQKVFPNDTLICKTVRTEKGFETTVIGWPEDLTAEQRAESEKSSPEAMLLEPDLKLYSPA